jgi:Na+-driven multidrug efflux pump
LALTGGARGCGWQNLRASINLGAYYVVGIPSAILFAFIFHIGGMVSYWASFSQEFWFLRVGFVFLSMKPKHMDTEHNSDSDTSVMLHVAVPFWY